MKLSKLALLAILLFSVSNAGAATLSESPANIPQGGTVTATWSAIAAPTNRDWIGLYTPAGVDTAFLDWIYVSCSKSAGAVLAAGSCSFPIPSSLPDGSYQLRLFTNNGYTRLATSNPFTVGPPPPLPPRFVDNGNGTITDNQTGLQWEKKTAACGSFSTDIHCVNNRYRWSSAGMLPDGSLFTNFLARINAELSSSADGITVADVCFAGHCDWRIPNIAELRTLVVANCPGNSLCIDPIFEPTGAYFYHSSTADAANAGFVWFVDFPHQGEVFKDGKTTEALARAVRGAR